MTKFFFILFFAFSITISFGQNFAFKAGGNIATTKDLVAFPKNKFGWYGGFSYQIPLKNKLFVQPEIIYSSKGYNTNDQFGAIYQSVRLNYLNIPILLNYRFDNRTSLLLGPEFGYLISANLVIDGESNINIMKQYPPRFDAAACIGLQYIISKYFCAEIRYNYGFNTLYSVDATGNRYTEENGANRVFQLGFRYLFQNKLQVIP